MPEQPKPSPSTPPARPDTLYASGTVDEDFTFNERVAEVFDDMLNRSIPYYRTVIEGMAQLLAARLPDGATVCDLGCSTGTTLLELARLLDSQTGVHLYESLAQPSDLLSRGAGVLLIETPS